MTEENDDRCLTCEWSDDRVTVQCEACRKACDAMIDHLMVAQAERVPGPRGQA